MARSSIRSRLSRPILATLAAALLFGASPPLAKALLSSMGPLTLAGLLYLGGALGTLPFAFRGGSRELRRDGRQRRLLSFAVIFGGGVAPVLLLQLLFATSPFLGVLLAWTVFGEHVQPAQLAAAPCIGVGLYLMLTARHEHAHTHEAMTHTHSHRHDDAHHTHVHVGLPPWVRHTHPHDHEPITHTHPHVPDLHHRHEHGDRERQ